MVPSQGSIVWIRQRPWQVERVTVRKHIVRLDVRDRRGRLTFLAPFDRIAGSETRRPKSMSVASAAARLASLAGSAPRWTSINTAIGARLDLHPHQLEPTLAVLRGARRVLIADEVGLGKTIQAGLVLAELEHRQGSLRALVICPVSLRSQWVEELEQRFSLPCGIADRDSLIATARSTVTSESAWKPDIVWIASIDYLKQPHVLEGIPLLPWDVVIIDEAHDAGGTTERHQACHDLACRARHVLLLTATPHSGDHDRFTRLTDIGRLAHDEIVVFRRTKDEVKLSGARQVRWHFVGPSPEEERLLDALETYEQVVLHAAGEPRSRAALLLLSVFRKRALSTAHALVRSIERRLEWLASPEQGYALDWMQPSLSFDALEEDQVGAAERAALIADIGMREADERRWLKRLLALAAVPGACQTKLQRVKGLARRAGEPVIVFTEFRDSLEALRKQLADTSDVSMLHGGVSTQNRREQLRRFELGDTSVLLATDVASQGLNLHTASRWVISLELPWNPVRLEQRIGRVDRIGQKRPVHATLLVSRHRTESAFLTRLARRIFEARQALGTDTLTLVGPPPETGIARRIFEQQAADPDGSRVHVRPCTTHRRTARAIGVAVSRRRRLMKQWQAPAPHGRPGRCRPHKGPTVCRRLLSAGSGMGIGVFSVPIVDSLHRVLERHLIVIAGLSPGRRPDDIALRAIEQVVRGRMESRRRRLQSMIGIAAGRTTLAEAAVLRHIRALSRPEETQSELFSRAASDIFDEARQTANRLEHLAVGNVRDAGAARDISVGSPTLELVVDLT